MTALNAEVAEHLRSTVESRRRFRKRNKTYHRDTAEFFDQLVDRQSRVLVIGCDVSEATELRCKQLTLIDLDPAWEMSALPGYARWIKQLDEAESDGPYDYILLPFTLQYLENIQAFLDRLRKLANSRTRLVVLQYNFLWAPVVRAAKRLSLRSPLPDFNWLNLGDVHSMLSLVGFQAISSGARCLIPVYVPLLTWFANRWLAPLLPWLCQKSYVVSRLWPLDDMGGRPTISIVVPARNEEGNIKNLLDRLPVLAPLQEVIFVEGHSADKTWEEIQNQMETHPRRKTFDLRALQQTGRGKADAVRLGFKEATGDIVMILDADLSVQPEDLSYFYEPLVRRAAEFVNGSRLVYGMERYAMQVLNLFFNKVFGILVSWQLGQDVKDTLCGTKALYRNDYERLVRKKAEAGGADDPFGDFELLFGASQLYLKIADVPVRYKERRYGSTNIRRFRNGWQLLRFCLSSWGRGR